MRNEPMKERGFVRAIAMIALAYLLALSPVLSSKIQSSRAAAREQTVLSGWNIICSADGAAADRDRGNDRPAGHAEHHHCALCSTLAALLGPAPAEIYLPAQYRLVAAAAMASAIGSLRDSGWSTSWSARAPPFAA
jgi:Protein of unknown function (DUF2946)